jgi:hypothetical protein
LLALVSLLLAAEFFSFLYVRYVAQLAWAPAYVAGSATPRRVGAWSVDDAPWGAWRRPNARARHESACFSVALHSNSVGARDRERARAAQGNARGRVVVLGDSFAEGWGVADADRLTNRLEVRDGREYLNFAVPSAGPAQYMEIYENLALGFAHDQVMIVLLPANDFTDNDPERRSRGGEGPQKHHRYLVPTQGGGYRVSAPLELGARGLDQEPPRGWLNQVEKVIRDNLWVHGAVAHLKNIVGADPSWSGYYDYTPEQLAAVEWALARIRAMAGPRQVTLVLAPRLNDFIRARTSPDPPLVPALQEFAKKQGMVLIDLLGPMRARDADGTRLYNVCDGHWNEAGNALAADVLLAAMKGPVR